MNVYVKCGLVVGAVVVAKVAEHLYLRKVIKDTQANVVDMFKKNPELFKKMSSETTK
jgi:hypothetical protein